MKAVIIACLTSVSVVSMYLGYNFFYSEPETKNIAIQKVDADPVNENKPDQQNNIQTKPKVNSKKVKQDISITLKEKKRPKKKNKKSKKPQREFKELLEDDIEFIEMT